jgi:pimeloyl-ACP methyl ester carboxylesterase
MSATLLFLHGGPGYKDYLEQFFANQFPSDIQTVFYSQLQKDPITVEDLLNELHEKVRESNHPIYLVGHSWGGVLGLQYLRQFPDHKIMGIVLINSFINFHDATTEYLKELESKKLYNPSLEQIFFTPIEARTNPTFIRWLESHFNEQVFQQVWGAFASTFDATEFIKGMKIPALNIYGDLDIRIPARRIKTYAELNNQIQNLEMEGAGHFSFILEDNRKLTVQAILKFINYS